MQTLSIVLISVLAFASAAVSSADTPNFDELVEIANRYKLPKPKQDAKPVLGFSGSWRSSDAGIYRPGFVTKNETKKKVRVLVGFNEMICQERKRVPATRPYTLTSPDETKDGYSIEFGHLSNFETAVQLAMIDKKDDAKQLWKRFSQAKFMSGGHPHEGINQLRQTPNVLLAICIFKHIEAESLKPGTNFVEYAERLEKLRNEYPSLFSKDSNNYTPYARDQFVEDLQLTAKAIAPPAGSIEELLVRWGNSDGEMRHLGYFSSHNVVDDAPAREIFYRVDAVKNLLKLTKDRRLSVHVQPAIMNSPPYRNRMGDLAENLLRQIAGATAPTNNNRLGDSSHWAKWAEQNSLDDEASFLLKAAFNDETGVAYEVPLRILDERHREKFKTFCETIGPKTTDKTYCHYFTNTIRDSKMPATEKTRLLTLLAKQLPAKQKRYPVQALAKVDGASTSKLVLPLISKIPQDVDEPYWTSESANLTHVVMQIDDLEVWRAYLVAAKKASVGLRMEMMNPMNYSYISGQQRNLRLAFLAEFIDDETVRDRSVNSKKFDGPCAGFTFPKISVQNFVTMKLASLLIKDYDRPDSKWNAAQWSELQSKVRKELAQQDLPNLSQ